jgi:predicted O-methyltransferase YrrM
MNYALDDTYLKEKIQEIIKNYNINTIIETGINNGDSTIEFSKMVEKVIGIDIMESCIHTTYEKLEKHSIQNVELYIGNSPEILSKIIPSIDVDNTIFFFDAHWYDYWPIIDEIEKIPKNKGIIIVHDFFVPNNTDLGYDVYKNIKFDYEYIKNALNDWSPTHRVEYNSKANGSCRGVGFIYNS